MAIAEASSGGPMSETDPAAREAACWRNVALATIAGFALARVALAYALGLGIDESYTIAVSRRLSLSYFDHPPLHQWLAHYLALLVGEGPSLRLPFIALFAATGWLTFALTRELFDARAGALAAFALNASPFFFVSAGGWVVPDGPLLLALAAAALCFSRLFFGERGPEGEWRLWLAGGFWLGLAGLSKYSAALAPLGLVAFMALSPGRRRWFAHPAPYLSGLMTLAMVAPVIVWNAENHWVSFAFQGARGAPGAAWRPAQAAQMLLGEMVWLAPWIFVPLIGGLVAAIRRAPGDDRRLFLLCLALPPIVLFNLTPLWGARGLPHWPAPGWFFAYPLLGVWLAQSRATSALLRGWAIGSAALLGAATLALAAQAQTGWITRLIRLPTGAVDPSLEALNWAPLARSPLFDPQQGSPPAFVVSMKWSEAGKIALALGPRIPVVVFSGDPRGFAFLDDPARFLGEDAVIVVDARAREAALAACRPYFASLGEPETMTLDRGGVAAVTLALIPAHGLTRSFPLPYPR